MLRSFNVFRTVGLMLAAAFALGMPSQAWGQANLIVNPGFETGSFSGWSDTGDNSYSGVGNNATLSSNGMTFSVFNGTYSVFLGTITSNNFLGQSVATTPGTEYVFSFELASDGGTPNSFSAAVDGNTVYSATNAGRFGWTLFSYDFTASTSSTPVLFTSFQEPAYWGLDDVSVTAVAVPEPAEWGVLGALGAAAAAIVVRRRKRLQQER